MDSPQDALQDAMCLTIKQPSYSTSVFALFPSVIQHRDRSLEKHSNSLYAILQSRGKHCILLSLRDKSPYVDTFKKCCVQRRIVKFRRCYSPRS